MPGSLWAEPSPHHHFMLVSVTKAIPEGSSVPRTHRGWLGGEGNAGVPSIQRSAAMCCQSLSAFCQVTPRRPRALSLLNLPQQSWRRTPVNPGPQDAGAGRSMQAGARLAPCESGLRSKTLFEQKLLNTYIKSRILSAPFPALWMTFAFLSESFETWTVFIL